MILSVVPCIWLLLHAVMGGWICIDVDREVPCAQRVACK